MTDAIDNALSDRVGATDRSMLKWALKGFDLIGEALVDLAQDDEPLAQVQAKLFMLAIALADATNKLEAYLDGAEATLTTDYDAN